MIRRYRVASTSNAVSHYACSQGRAVFTFREIIRRLLNTSHVRPRTSITTEIVAQNAVLEARKILKVDVELAAVLSFFFNINSSSDRRNHVLEDDMLVLVVF